MFPAFELRLGTSPRGVYRGSKPFTAFNTFKNEILL
jgi:hypothetical protein